MWLVEKDTVWAMVAFYDAPWITIAGYKLVQ